MPHGKAVRYRERAVELGVPESAVLVEPKARNTGENIRFSRALLEGAGVDVSSVLLVSKPYEERRAYATARKLWPGVDIVSASSPMTFEAYVASNGDDRLVIDMLVGALGPHVTGGQPTFRCRAVLGRDAPGARCPGHRWAGRRLPRVSVVTAPDRNGSL